MHLNTQNNRNTNPSNLHMYNSNHGPTFTPTYAPSYTPYTYPTPVPPTPQMAYSTYSTYPSQQPSLYTSHNHGLSPASSQTLRASSNEGMESASSVSGASGSSGTSGFTTISVQLPLPSYHPTLPTPDQWIQTQYPNIRRAIQLHIVPVPYHNPGCVFYLSPRESKTQSVFSGFYFFPSTIQEPSDPKITKLLEHSFWIGDYVQIDQNHIFIMYSVAYRKFVYVGGLFPTLVRCMLYRLRTAQLRAEERSRESYVFCWLRGKLLLDMTNVIAVYPMDAPMRPVLSPSHDVGTQSEQFEKIGQDGRSKVRWNMDIDRMEVYPWMTQVMSSKTE